ncbi:hypothetical protein A2686_01580 [Candidatus Woesebacteria bacterium RIFCSPHIGHO2_01_FULL_38_10]|uniref:Uncharacterized protein n=1 Tax=Candidatus Woesebacteria bacterium RIFCSPLOWO2_01_FULL_39_10b TaxID=1802517 RepID=A0A1F8B6F9_9BACT|nr:MAG: hypothetical protein A2686_01580 [Candidatus Woesebacteria bacterium RIFCSPHIGHO2_01_FULL_38_10]OGM59587.1 MAG: hypothetical protein A2892_04545 [Candidatus Woesebacteria bacterium RIFCSPLOWO2_01_FULL_39_10b]
MKNQKKFIFLIFLIISFLSIIFPRKAYSQENDFEKLYQEYLTTFDEYRKTHSDYSFKKAQYLRFKTLKSQEEAFNATLTMLQKRDDLVIAFSKVLKEKLKISSEVGVPKNEPLNARIDQEVGWFNEHKEKLTSAASLENLVKDSNEAKLRFAKIQVLSYDLLATISEAKIIVLNKRTREILDRVKNKFEEIKSQDNVEDKFSTYKLQIIDRWIFESENRLIRGEEKLINAQSLIATFASKQTGDNALSLYNQSQTVLGESQLFFKEAISSLKEVIREIKIAE